MKSMTGYGRAEKENQLGRVVVEITTTNRRHLEIFLGLPKELASHESQYRERVGKHLKRGRAQVNIEFQSAPEGMEFFLDLDLAKKYYEALQMLGNELKLKDDITLKDILSYKEILSFERSSVKNEELFHFIYEVLENALVELVDMRAREGDALGEDIVKRLRMIDVKVQEIQSLSPLAVERYQTKLKTKMAELLSSLEGTDERIMREVALMAERVDISEEVVRLKSHTQQFFSALDSQEVVGRLMDFLTQEMNREINTIASKSSDLEISRLTIEIRNELDKIREQIQNIE